MTVSRFHPSQVHFQIMISTQIPTISIWASTLLGLLMLQDESSAQSASAKNSQPRPMQLEDLIRYDRLADPQLHPKGS